MASTKRYALEKGGPKRLAVKRRWFFKNTEVTLDGQPVGPPIRNLDALKAGQTFLLPDGRTLGVGFQKSMTAAGITLTVDGRPVPGAPNHPVTTIRAAAKLLWFLAGINVLIGAFLLGATDSLRDIGLGVLVFGAVIAGLGFAVYFLHSRLALAAAIVIEVIDAGVTFALTPQGRPPPVGAIFFRVLIIVALVQAYQAVERARRLAVDEKIDQAFS